MYTQWEQIEPKRFLVPCIGVVEKFFKWLRVLGILYCTMLVSASYKFYL